ncbi:hypothetical protein TruAng_008288 [Truncatella angustata]|nr:hypothetical protein TruAng_008288 [Truncatella angustata]
MDKTKEAVSKFMSKAGHHDTTVHEHVQPAVQHETIRPQQHEEVNTALDREVHQDHYHHTVQPVQDKEVLPEQHHHNVGQVEHRSFDHRDESKVKRALEAERAKFSDQRVREEAVHTQSSAPVVQGEHVHHHVHETYQPVVHKETIEPHVVHTTVPIHETHHNEAKHHATSTLPAVSMSEFKQHGGTHRGGQHEEHRFEGCPDVEGGAHSHNKGLSNITSAGAGVAGAGVAAGGHRHRRSSSVSSSDREGVSGPHKSKVANKLDPRVDSDRDGSRTVGNNNTASSGAIGGYSAGTTGSRGVGNSGVTTGAVGSGGYTSGSREGVSGPHNSRAANTLDPRVDSDRDGSRTAGTTGTSTGTAGQHHSSMLDVGSTPGSTGTTSSRTGTTGLSNTTGNNTALGTGTTGLGYAQGHSRVDSGHSTSEDKPGLLEKVGNKLGLTSSHNSETTGTQNNDGVFNSVNSRR